MAGPKTKSFVGMQIQTSYAFGEAFAGVLASQIKGWKDYQASYSLPTKLKASHNRFGVQHHFLSYLYRIF